MADTNSTPNNENVASERGRIARWMIGGGMGAITALAVVLISHDTSPTQEGCKTAFNMLVPLIGTWIGTVLAYYFSGENFQKASESMNKMMGKVMDDKLKTIPVKEVMIARANMTAIVLQTGDDGAKVNLKTDILDRFNDTITRMPVFTDKDVSKYVIHASEVFQFVTQKTIAQTTAAPFDVAKPTLKDFLGFNKNEDFVSKTIAYVGIDATLADAKAKMEAVSDCQDVIVTDDGSPDKPVRGWLTNVQIAKRSKA